MGETTRRQVLRTAAWSLPVVAVAIATPGAAASTVSSFEFEIPPEWQTVITPRVANTGTTTLTITVSVITDLPPRFFRIAFGDWTDLGDNVYSRAFTPGEVGMGPEVTSVPPRNGTFYSIIFLAQAPDLDPIARSVLVPL